MLRRRSSIAGWLVALAASAVVVGCRTAERKPETSLSAIGAGSHVDPVNGVVPVSATSTASQPQAGTFTISLATFIPSNYVPAPVIHPQSFTGLVPQRLVFSGDDRGFDVDAARFRAKQVVTLVPDAAIDADGLIEKSKLNIGGVTESFIASQALYDGRIDHRDHTGYGDITERSLHRSVPVDVGGMIIDDPIRLGPQRVSVRLHTANSGGPRDQLIAGAPSIDWDLTITIDTSGPEPRYDLTGKWDGYPAMEIYVNRQPIYQHRGEVRTPTMTDLLKLVPMYGDLTVKSSGVLRRPN